MQRFTKLAAPTEGRGKVRCRRIAVANRRTEALLERPVFGVERPLSNARGIRGPCGGNVPIERRGGNTEALRDLRDGNVGIGEHRIGGLDIVIREFWRTASGTRGDA
jgi:hypothetical protein